MREAEILEVAETLIEVHGEKTWFEVAKRADCAANHSAARRNWRRILKLVEAIQNIHLGENSTMH
jgi:hypothetical protein